MGLSASCIKDFQWIRVWKSHFYHGIFMLKETLRASQLTHSWWDHSYSILNKTVQYSWVITTKWSRSYQVVSRLQEVLNALLVNWSHWLSWSVGHFIAICEQGEQLCAVKDHFLPPGPQPVEPVEKVLEVKVQILLVNYGLRGFPYNTYLVLDKGWVVPNYYTVT